MASDSNGGANLGINTAPCCGSGGVFVQSLELAPETGDAFQKSFQSWPQLKT